MPAITVSTTVNAPIDHVWEVWNNPEHITQWCFASDDWHAPKAENDLRVGGKFTTRMEAKDGSFGFEFGGMYTNINGKETIEYSMDDGRKVSIKFEDMGDSTKVTETFDAETQNSEEMQRAGRQAILDNFKKRAEET
ncbi:SRPBCC family protein [Patescibacteria group bacterium]|nr:SRPBCC family protein [Patescibacteria group bacterium]